MDLSFLQEANWPKGTVKELTVWCGKLASLVESMQRRIITLENDNTAKAAEINSLKSASAPPTDAWSSIVAGSKRTDLECAIITLTRKESLEQNKIAKNVIVSGIAEAASVNADEAKANDKTEIDELLKTINADNCIVKRINRLGKRGDDQARARPLIVEFDSIQSKVQVCTSANKLRNTTNYKKVFINEDRTLAQRTQEKKIREERDKRNSQLEEEDNEGRHFGRFIDSSNVQHKFYRGVRNGELKRIYKQ